MSRSLSAVLIAICGMFLLFSGASQAQISSTASGMSATDTTFTYVGLSILPATIQMLPEDSTSLSIRLEDAMDVGAFQIGLVFAPDILAIEDVILTEFLGSSGRTAGGPFTHYETGYVTFAALTLGSHPGVSGNGDLAIVTVRAKAVGETSISFQQSRIFDTESRRLLPGKLTPSHVKVDDYLYHYLPMLTR
ncbi:MAG: hypothetical protein GY759_21710 [Chloroflexi bacterium]|nr:hypothetical protein [Chloroflexota bacterium]